MNNQILIKIENAIVAALGTYFYFSYGYSWWVFLLLLLAPDIFMFGYAFGNKVGAYVYNIAHTFVTPVLLLLAGHMFSISFLTMIGFIWLVHIGVDRTVGYGLKYTTDFKNSHIQRI
ncbi:DUF4260 domain-containing protein [Paenibacillus xylanexedens]|uniref:DUF4260 domain-containing protein n=1 Tax=Paenibacillus xylanexedens TaxID=528191 RepID=UPI0009382A20|nr:DUF4260 domain-containing protein [Paenibacillus xylanexedens]APO43060.1 hypothetical protein BS614_02585 [Paenibacillus xylanexedens]